MAVACVQVFTVVRACAAREALGSSRRPVLHAQLRRWIRWLLVLLHQLLSLANRRQHSERWLSRLPPTRLVDMACCSTSVAYQ